ncbi:MAG: retroviral-like aspartic protease family protein [Bacteroidetes bacterium]|uniref:Retroviral-like aspartic protease family protein n=1 Tax=Candidatus Gallipaludibacter merdavium TaxID=2840839 RepID=A0A9D9HS96_9BACT|nr:retroviral-like aspartic protease family protein [Candidatus Gallipaludibacter merdavium]
MMKQRFLTVVFVALSVMLAACGGKEKPSPRVDVWGSNDGLRVSMDAPKIEVPFKRTGGDLAEIQVSLNGVPFNMWWDTGASMLCISSLEFTKMYKEGRITDADYKGEIATSIADGSTVKSQVYTIREVDIQGMGDKWLRLYNVDAVVSGNSNAPSLIGQNVIQQLPKHTFNESTGMIEFEGQR